MKDYESLMKRRSHVVLLGAGASVAAIPNGDKNGKKTSVMSGFIEKLGMRDIFDTITLKTKSDNLEDIYSEIVSSNEHKEFCKELEKRIYDYFSSFAIPDEPTVYDYLLLSLTSKDLIATFNWDPLLLQAYQRVQRLTENLPQVVFLHGNVMVGICHEHKKAGLISMRCPECKQMFKSMELLFPVSEKDYERDPLIADSWQCVKRYLEKAYMFTVFGYSAPVSDKAAIDLLKYAWGESAHRDLEEVELIDIRKEDELRQTWDAFIHTHHYSIHESFFDSTLGRFPRRSCESTFDRLMNCDSLYDSKGFKSGMTFDDCDIFLQPLFEDEFNSKGKLNNPYK